MVWCDRCRTWHTHGYDPAAEEDGHRAAHCPSGWYREDGGYQIRIKGNWDDLTDADCLRLASPPGVLTFPGH